MTEDNQVVRIRATINLPNLPLGQTALARRGEPYVEMCIRSGHVVIEGPAEEQGEPAS